MLELETISITGMHHDGSLLWIAAPEERLVAPWRGSTGEMAERLTYAHQVWDVCPDKEGLWLVTGGGRLGRQLVLWSPAEARAIRQFNCPDGAGAGMTLLDGKIWLAHRHNRKLFCLDPESVSIFSLASSRRGRESWSVTQFLSFRAAWPLTASGFGTPRKGRGAWS